MKVLNFFRKPYFAYLAGFMLLFVSCKQYDDQFTLKEQENIDFKEAYQKYKNPINYIKSLNISDYQNIKELKTKLINNNKNSGYNFTEDDINYAVDLLNQFGVFQDNVDNQMLFSNLINYAYVNNVISLTTKDFLNNNLVNFGNFVVWNQNIQSFINNNPNINGNELNFLNSLIIDSNTRSVNCHTVAQIAVIAAGGLFLAVAVPYLAGAIFLAAWGDAVEGICEQA